MENEVTKNKIILVPPRFEFLCGTLISAIFAYLTLSHLATFPPLILLFIVAALTLYFYLKSLVISLYNFLILDAEGFTVKVLKEDRWDRCKARKKYFWSDVSHFKTGGDGHRGKQSAMRVYFVNTPTPEKEWYDPLEFKIPYNYRMDADELSKLMNTWRDKHKKSQ